MIQDILRLVINYLVPVVLGYCISRIKAYKDKLEKVKNNENVQNAALLTIIQSNLTNTYFVYNKLKQIPDYVMRNWNNLFDIYQKLGGNDYCHALKTKMEQWDIVHTDIL